MSIKQKIIGILLAIIALLGGGNYVLNSNQLGSARVGEQYQSTTTPQVADRAVLCPATGVLSSVNVLGGGTGELLILDATTTDPAKRTGNLATSTIILAWYPAGFATSSNHFDISFKRGLLVDYGTGVPTTTIAYRCEG